MLLRGVDGLCIASGHYSCRCTDARRMFRCLSGGSSGAPFDHVLISFRSGQHCSDGYSDAFSLNHRTFRCLGLAGPLVLFSLNPSAGPRVSLSHCLSSFSRNRRPLTRPHAAPPPPLQRRPSATASAPLLLCFAAAPRACTRARAAPAPAPRCAALRCPAPPAPRAAAFHAAPPLRSSSARAFPCSFALLEPQQGLCPTLYTP